MHIREYHNAVDEKSYLAMHIREYNSVYGDTPSENDSIEATTEAPNAGKGITDDINKMLGKVVIMNPKVLSNMNLHILQTIYSL